MRTPLPPFEPLDGRLAKARIALLAVAVFALVVIASDAFELELLGRVRDGEAVGIPEVDSNDVRQSAVGAIGFVLAVAAAVFWLRWFSRAYKNLDAVKAHNRFGHGWAIGAWFVPFLSLWRPKQMADEIWRGGGDGEPGVLLGAWWGLWLVGTWAGSIVARLAFRQDSLDELMTLDRVDMAASVLDLVAAVLAITVARRSTARLHARRAALEAAAPPPVPASAQAALGRTSSPGSG